MEGPALVLSASSCNYLLPAQKDGPACEFAFFRHLLQDLAGAAPRLALQVWPAGSGGPSLAAGLCSTCLEGLGIPHAGPAQSQSRPGRGSG